MANDFTNAQEVGVTTVRSIYTAPALKASIILELDISNTTNSVVTVSAEVVDVSASTSAYIVKDAPVSTGGALQVVAGQKIILLAGDSIRVTASGASDVICSILEDVNS